MIREEKKEMFVYRLNVLETLSDAGYTPSKLRKEKLLGENAIQCLRENKMVGIKALDKICSILNTQPGNIIKYVDTTEK